MTATPGRMQLRPGVQVSTVPDGVHVRGWAGAFTITGGTDVHVLWQRLRPVIQAGIGEDAIGALAARTGPWRAAGQLIEGLAEHGMLVPAPAEPADLLGAATDQWFAQAAPEPARARRRVADAAVTVRGAGPLVDAACAALRAAGTAVTAVADPADDAVVVLRAEQVGGERSAQVVAGAGARTGFIAHAGASLSTGRLIAERLRMGRGAAPDLLAVAVAAAAAHRLLARVGGVAEPRAGAGVPWPTVLVADLDPLAVGPHPWTRGNGPAPTVCTDLDGAIAALCDGRLGVLPELDHDNPTQVPASLVRCGTEVVGAGTTVAGARYDAVLRAAERLVDPERGGRVCVGLDPLQVDGVLLRRAAFARAGRGAAAEAPTGSPIPADPDARRWWTTLTRRFAVEACFTLIALADRVHVAVVSDRAGRELGWAVETTAGSALAFAAFTAVARHQAHLAGLAADTGPATVCGASPTSPVATVWPRREPGERELQRSLRRWCPDGPRRRRVAGAIGSALAGTGLIVTEVPR